MAVASRPESELPLRVFPRPGVAWECVGRKIIVVNLTRGSLFLFDGEGAQLWRWLMRAPTRAVRGKMVRRYAMTPRRAERELGEFIVRLRDHRLV